jgi:hypothetical protein|tara:strand:- start:69 stop:764 length:696 start_codon:yes stop_codon:yes gene_type:complete
MNKESFIYIWYDSNYKMFYLGKHKGTPDDGYTHSSKKWQRFKSDSIPQGVRRRIIAWGIDEDMYELETKLLLNRKKKCWSRYYNVSIGGDFSADYNDPEYKKMMRKCNYDNPKVKQKLKKSLKARENNLDYKERMRKNNYDNEEVKEKIRQKTLGEKNSSSLGSHKITFENGHWIIVPNLARWGIDSGKYDFAQLFHLKRGWKIQGGKKVRILRCKDVVKVEAVKTLKEII